MVELPPLSSRGRQREETSSLPERGRWYDPNRNPDGPISIAVAENSLMSKELLQKVHSMFKLTPAHLKYRSSLEKSFEPNTLDALPAFFNRTLRPAVPITSKQIAVGPGLGAILAQLVWNLCEKGDGVLMTAPFYADYPRDIIYPAQAVPVIVHPPDGVDPLSVAIAPLIRQKIRESKDRPVKAVILCNPHNPLARCYPRETIIEYACIAEEFDIHLVVDEVFANEVFSSRSCQTPKPFISILSFTEQEISPCKPSRIHVLSGPTKDFGASGIKVGGLISQNNPDVIKVVTTALHATPVSSAADAVFTPILMDDQFCTEFLEENRKQLGQAFDLLCAFCDFHKLPYLCSEAGVFCLVDFGPILDRIVDSSIPIPEKMEAAVKAMMKGGIILRPSSASHDPVLTRFRVTFTRPREEMMLAFNRIEKVFSLPHWKEMGDKQASL